MFTGIIESLGKVQEIKKDKDNVHITIESSIADELKIDQSVAHNGICMTIVAIDNNLYTVTAIAETIKKTNLAQLNVGDSINLERAMRLGDRLDGHIVQGHVDQVGTCIVANETNGSWYYTFEYDDAIGNITIEKGSITVNGVSLTVVDSRKNQFSVAIIPYTYEHTNFNSFEIGTKVNLEFDLIGKYISKLHSNK
ncbi:riboflavin synthase [Flavobacterium nackdongense]|uniref:Riboflavin synthase n=1 Tax=Flavobacterium nackdongense TaxID=2547394 RepID=A0A4P6Y8D1_9FLAO|nr:riboflavin synthase [Flavobacterium nackdongense]QBN19079.1 riboflavin synthase [Flavobacterium nackdongense]